MCLSFKRSEWINCKALFAGILLALVFPLVVHAQDIIYKIDNKIIEARVLKISDSEVEYKRFSNPDGPTYSILKKQVKMIIYQNGEKDVFDQPAKEQAPQKPATEPAVTKTISAPVAYSVVSYANARSLLLNENINSAIVVYAQLVAKDTANVSLGSEYAFALALGGIYDAALARLDRVWKLESNNPDLKYFTSQVFLLMGFNQLAAEFHLESDIITVPSWIAVKAPALVQKYKRNKPSPKSCAREELVKEFKRANRLAAQDANLQSISVFEEITVKHPTEFLPYVGYSIALEKVGLYTNAANSIEKALNVIGTSPEQDETRQYLEKRLLALKTLSNRTVNTGSPQVIPTKVTEPQSRPMMAYAGGMIYSNYFNLNTKLGYFFTDNGNVSVNMGVTSSGGSTFLNMGLLYYQRYKKVMVGGFGLSANIGNSSATLYMKISPGFSIMNQQKSSSWDIFWDIEVPFSQKYATAFGFSVGKSFYFGNR